MELNKMIQGRHQSPFICNPFENEGKLRGIPVMAVQNNLVINFDENIFAD